jgi:hypothetical protein
MIKCPVCEKPLEPALRKKTWHEYTWENIPCQTACQVVMMDRTCEEYECVCGAGCIIKSPAVPKINWGSEELKIPEKYP